LEQIFKEAAKDNILREDGNDVEQKRMQQRARHATAQYRQVRPADADVALESEEEEEEYDDVWPPRMSSSARRYQDVVDVRTEVGRTTADVQSSTGERRYRTQATGVHSAIPPRRTATQTHLPAVPATRRRVTQPDILPERHSDELRLDDGPRRPRLHWLVLVGLTMLLMVIGWMGLLTLANWWQVTQNDWHYGRPRTYQTDAVVGHNDSPANPSHFIVLNLRRHVQIIEFPGGDPSKAKIYIGPTLIGPGQDLAVVTLSFKDVNGDGKPDMILNIQDSHFVFINDNGQYRPARPGENVQI
jgi:hypothetical protein